MDKIKHQRSGFINLKDRRRIYMKLADYVAEFLEKNEAGFQINQFKLKSG